MPDFDVNQLKARLGQVKMMDVSGSFMDWYWLTKKHRLNKLCNGSKKQEVLRNIYTLIAAKKCHLIIYSEDILKTKFPSVTFSSYTTYLYYMIKRYDKMVLDNWQVLNVAHSFLKCSKCNIRDVTKWSIDDSKLGYECCGSTRVNCIEYVIV